MHVCTLPDIPGLRLGAKPAPHTPHRIDIPVTLLLRFIERSSAAIDALEEAPFHAVSKHHRGATSIVLDTLMLPKLRSSTRTNYEVEEDSVMAEEMWDIDGHLHPDTEYVKLGGADSHLARSRELELIAKGESERAAAYATVILNPNARSVRAFVLTEEGRRWLDSQEGMSCVTTKQADHSHPTGLWTIARHVNFVDDSSIDIAEFDRRGI